MDHVTDSLYISDIDTVQTEPTQQFDAVITICQDTICDNIGNCEYHHFPLSDGPPIENSYNPGVFEYEVFENAVNTIIEHAEAGDKTVVHCHAGQSRSVIALATALSAWKNIPYQHAIYMITDARSKDIRPDGDVEQFSQQYIHENKGGHV